LSATNALDGTRVKMTLGYFIFMSTVRISRPPAGFPFRRQFVGHV
jgi:hypothetical protein